MKTDLLLLLLLFHFSLPPFFLTNRREKGMTHLLWQPPYNKEEEVAGWLLITSDAERKKRPSPNNSRGKNRHRNSRQPKTSLPLSQRTGGGWLASSPYLLLVAIGEKEEEIVAIFQKWQPSALPAKEREGGKKHPWNYSSCNFLSLLYYLTHETTPPRPQICPPV